MSSFDAIGDTANRLKTEAQEIKLSFKQGVPATGQGTIEWNIPGPAQGCQSGEDGVYAGMVLLLHTEPMDATNIPQTGVLYTADPTADFDLSTADRIGDALVIGAIYECENKARGEVLTKTIIINDLKPGVSYYVAGYALDCQNRYHSDGIRSYSGELSTKQTDIPGEQRISLGTNGAGVLPTDGTGLVAGTFYEFDIIVDDTFPDGSGVKTVEITLDGIDAGTYQDLVDNINRQLLLANNPPQSILPPNAGAFFWDATAQKLFQFDGVNYNEIDVLLEPTDPADVPMGSYWYDTTNKVLNRWNIPTPTGWNVIDFIESESDPSAPNCGLYWYDNTLARKWNGTTWCDQETLITATDPTTCPVIDCGSYWYDETTNGLLEWNPTNAKWETATAVFWPLAPNQLSTGTYWYDDTNRKLFQRSGIVWNDLSSTALIQEATPTAPVNGLLWYKPSTEALTQYSSGSPSGFISLSVLVWPEDPTVVKSCDLWWDSVSDNLFTWDIVNNEWDQVANFTQSTLDPTEPAPLATDEVWYNPSDDTMFRWDGAAWVSVPHISKLTDPTQITVGSGWFQPSTNTWNVWGTPGVGWNVINPTDSTVDPNNIINGTYWYDTTANALFVRNGITWTVVTFTMVPFVPSTDSEWFDSANNALFTWNGTEYVPATPCAIVRFDSSGSLIFNTTGVGGNNVILIPAPDGAISSTSPCSIGTGFAYNGSSITQCEFFDSNVARVYETRDIDPLTFLWNFVVVTPNILRPRSGNDGKSLVPTYEELGVGDDGSPDIRRELMDTIRVQLGYPVVEVELTNQQLDICVDRALESFRKRSSASVRRAFYSLTVEPGQQRYLMSNKILGYNKITNVMAAYRFNSAFLGNAGGGNAAFGQMVLQNLYNMGTYDLTSFFLVSQYIEQLEDLFATRLTFGWSEYERLLSFNTSFYRNERILLDCMVERTEQDLLTDRLSKSWLEKYALSEAMMMLSHIRGKFASLPGAGGGIALNSGELVAQAQANFDELRSQIDDFVVDRPEDVGQNSTFILG